MIKEVDFISVILFLLAVFLAGIAQALLKQAAITEHQHRIQEYFNWRVVLGYGIMLVCMLLNVIAYRELPLSLGMVMETLSYINITIYGALLFQEKITKLRGAALCLILGGIVMYAS